VSAAPALWLREAEVAALVDLPDAIAALERALAAEAEGRIRPLAKTHVETEGGATLHALGAAFESAGVAGTKTWLHSPGGATPLLVLWDTATGGLVALIEAFALGQLRTAAASGVATRWMARDDARELAMIGSGRQALAQVAAVAAVRPLARVRVWSPNAEHRAAFAGRLAREKLVPEVSACETLADAVRGADVVTTATRAREPFLGADLLARGAHVNAIGAITPERAELRRDVFARAALVATDSPAALRELSREVADAIAARVLDPAAVEPLGARVARGAKRPAGCDLTLFESLGSGVADLAVGMAVLERARAAGSGRPVPAPERAAIRLGPRPR
jgi:ornithine cyclodeaminase